MMLTVTHSAPRPEGAKAKLRPSNSNVTKTIAKVSLALPAARSPSATLFTSSLPAHFITQPPPDNSAKQYHPPRIRDPPDNGEPGECKGGKEDDGEEPHTDCPEPVAPVVHRPSVNPSDGLYHLRDPFPFSLDFIVNRAAPRVKPRARGGLLLN